MGVITGKELTMRRLRSVLAGIVGSLVLVVGAAVPGSAAPAVHQYQMVELGTLGGIYGVAMAVNDHGAVAGMSTTAQGLLRPFLWRDGRMINLGALGDNVKAIALDINNRGDVVGTSEVPGQETSRAILWRDGRMFDLGTLGGRGSVATGVNDLGVVVGYSDTADNDTHAFRWERGVMTDLGSFMATDVNDRGQIVGGYETPAGYHAALWSENRLVDLGVTVGTFSEARAINDRGWIVGNSIPDRDNAEAFLWRDGTMRALPTLGGTASAAQGISNAGMIVGTAQDRTGQTHNVAWNRGRVVDLEARGILRAVDGADVVDVNSRGDIVGSYYPLGGMYDPMPVLYR
jgi:probable HAF family extracellular repeat protein